MAAEDAAKGIRARVANVDLRIVGVSAGRGVQGGDPVGYVV